MNIETRVRALEAHRAKPPGKIRLYTAEAAPRDLEPLDALLYSLEAEAGKAAAITDYEYLGGDLPRGGIWEPFYDMLREVRARADPALRQSTRKP